MITVIFALIINISPAQDESAARGDYPLDDRYKGGSNLIFDCQRQHYACVDKDGLQLCKEAREKSMQLKVTPYACAPLETFDEKKKCLLKNYKVIEKNAWKRFCFPKT